VQMRARMCTHRLVAVHILQLPVTQLPDACRHPQSQFKFPLTQAVVQLASTRSSSLLSPVKSLMPLSRTISFLDILEVDIFSLAPAISSSPVLSCPYCSPAPSPVHVNSSTAYTPTTINLRASSPLTPTQAIFPRALAPRCSKQKSSLYRKALRSYLKKTEEGQVFLHQMKERHAASWANINRTGRQELGAGSVGQDDKDLALEDVCSSAIVPGARGGS
jgi:hypothetical protein